MKNEFLKHIKNDIYLTENDILVLKRNEIDYLNCLNLKELIFKIEDLLNNDLDDLELENLSLKLSEYNYYYKTNK